MKISIMSPVLLSRPNPRTIHVLEITPCIIPHRPNLTDETALNILHWLFRQFNRSDGSELISVFSLHMPSLSIGDTVELESLGTWRCENTGWSRIS